MIEPEKRTTVSGEQRMQRKSDLTVNGAHKARPLVHTMQVGLDASREQLLQGVVLVDRQLSLF
jgi:hypothetical protein